MSRDKNVSKFFFIIILHEQKWRRVSSSALNHRRTKGRYSTQKSYIEKNSNSLKSQNLAPRLRLLHGSILGLIGGHYDPDVKRTIIVRCDFNALNLLYFDE
jgi:hypothetical protein